MIQDRMTRGIIAGISGAMVQNIYMLVIKEFGLTKIMYIDIARRFLFAQDYMGAMANVVAFLGQIAIDSIWGVLIAFLLKFSSSKYYWLKGMAFGAGIWFFVRVFGIRAFGIIPGELPVEAFCYYIGALLFGLTATLVLKGLDKNQTTRKVK